MKFNFTQFSYNVNVTTVMGASLQITNDSKKSMLLSPPLHLLKGVKVATSFSLKEGGGEGNEAHNIVFPELFCYSISIVFYRVNI